jgi:hypothetical protein
MLRTNICYGTWLGVCTCSISLDRVTQRFAVQSQKLRFYYTMTLQLNWSEMGSTLDDDWVTSILPRASIRSTKETKRDLVLYRYLQVPVSYAGGSRSVSVRELPHKR